MYLVLAIAPSSCCAWMRSASCFCSSMSLPWACLMKGCSKRWVTDGRFSKSLIRHLQKHRIVSLGFLKNCFLLWTLQWSNYLAAIYHITSYVALCSLSTQSPSHSLARVGLCLSSWEGTCDCRPHPAEHSGWVVVYEGIEPPGSTLACSTLPSRLRLITN